MINNQTMSKLYLCILPFIIIFSITGCKTDTPVKRATIISDTKPEQPAPVLKDVLLGCRNGIYYSKKGGSPVLLREEPRVSKILKTSYGYFFKSENGILFSDNLTDFSYMNTGINKKTLKHFDGQKKYFKIVIDDLKDLEFDPVNENNLITATKDGAYYSTNRGQNWDFLPNPGTVNGIKSVAIYTQNKNTYIMVSHPYKGIYLKNLTSKSKWELINTGLYQYGWDYEEISDITAVPNDTDSPDIYAISNFNMNIYKYDTKNKRWISIYKNTSGFEVAESLGKIGDNLYFINENSILSCEISSGNLMKSEIKDIYDKYSEDISPDCLSGDINGESINLSGLWILNKPERSPYYEKASGKRGLYLNPQIIKTPAIMQDYITFLKKSGLNSAVIDMKDDNGNLRFNTNNPILNKYGKVKNPVNLETLFSYTKKENIYMTARVVLFKDPVLYNYDGGKFAVKDRLTGNQWAGYTLSSTGEQVFYEESWVDPFCEYVWMYNVELCKELIKLGFDEIQFDYVRFPTDGDNLNEIVYRYKDSGMDKESALISFLQYARENIKAPISIDIYGANGWYRTGGRTGQETEMLKDYVDVICPMYYPSHFDDSFMNYPPSSMRTYRIYYYGSLRNYYISRRKVVIRPYVQAFKMGVAYDVEFYGREYILNQLNGIKDATNNGFTFWNTSSNYKDIFFLKDKNYFN